MSDIKTELQARLDQLRAIQAKLELHRRAGLPLDSGEAALQAEGDEVVDQLDAHTGDEIAQLTQALQRVEEGTYGICSECGDPIDPRRLKAVPTADKCADHAD